MFNEIFERMNRKMATKSKLFVFTGNNERMKKKTKKKQIVFSMKKEKRKKPNVENDGTIFLVFVTNKVGLWCTQKNPSQNTE